MNLLTLFLSIATAAALILGFFIGRRIFYAYTDQYITYKFYLPNGKIEQFKHIEVTKENLSIITDFLNNNESAITLTRRNGKVTIIPRHLIENSIIVTKISRGIK